MAVNRQLQQTFNAKQSQQVSDVADLEFHTRQSKRLTVEGDGDESSPEPTLEASSDTQVIDSLRCSECIVAHKLHSDHRAG